MPVQLQSPAQKSLEIKRHRKQDDDDVTVLSIFSGLKTRSLGLNTLGTMKSSASSQSVHVSRKSLNVVLFISQT